MPDTVYRSLNAAEVQRLQQLGNYADDWSAIQVADPFCADCLCHNSFVGPVRLGPVAKGSVTRGDLTLREGIYNSTLAHVTIGDHPVIHNVRMLSGYSLGRHVVMFNIDEMTCTSDPHHVAWLEPMNENGGRRLLPFSGMTIADAYLWARYRGRKVLMQKLEEFTFASLATPEGAYGIIGDYCTIKNTKALRNVTIRSAECDPSTVDGCILLSDGIVGFGCTLEHGVIAARFLLGEHVHLEFGLRLNDTVVGDNSTLARCEVGNSIIFPAHEQHHNNSFLIAALIMGQSNIAAGGTIGSNHNSRTADNELAAGRGFWPGLCCSFKHSSRFASYCLLAKGDYPAELDIQLPFALVNNNVSQNRLEVMPAYWWMYNMYAMDRNSKKFAKRDKRVIKSQNIEFDNLAPDTAEEILHAIDIMRQWGVENGENRVPAGVFEKGNRPVVLLKGREALQAYEEMLLHYTMKTLRSRYSDALPPVPSRIEPRVVDWVNVGGQLIARHDLEAIFEDVECGKIDSWQGLNQRLNACWGDRYFLVDKPRHAYALLCHLQHVDHIDQTLWQQLLQRHQALLQLIDQRKISSRQKDDVNPFRAMTFFDAAERDAVMA